MIGLDTTVLLAHELSEIANHETIRKHVAEASRRAEARFALVPQVIQEFLHVATDPRRFQTPLPFEDALRRAEFWWNAVEITHCAPNDVAMKLFFEWMREYRLGRKRILDTALAASYYARGINRLATANPNDFAIFGVFAFESWAILT